MKVTTKQARERSALYDGLWDARNKLANFDCALETQAKKINTINTFSKLHIVWQTLKQAEPGTVSGEQLQELGPNLPFQLVVGFAKKQRGVTQDVSLVAILGPDPATVGPFEAIVVSEDRKPILATIDINVPGAQGLAVPRQTTDYNFLSKAIVL